MKTETRLKKHLQEMKNKNMHLYNSMNEIENIPFGRVSSYGKSGYQSIKYKGNQYAILRSYNDLVAIYDYKSEKVYFDTHWKGTRAIHIKAFVFEFGGNYNQIKKELKKGTYFN